MDARSDLFSFVVLDEPLAGRGRFDGASDLERLQAVIHPRGTPLGELRNDLPDGLRLAIENAFEKDPADQYQTAGDLAADLRRVTRQHEEGLPAAPTAGWRTALRPTSRRALPTRERIHVNRRIRT